MIETKAEFRKTLIIPKDPVKTGQGDKQVDVWYIRDRDDKDGAKGSQSTCTSPAAVEWTVDQRYRSHLQMAVNTREVVWAAAQATAEREGVGKLWDPDAEDPVAKRMRETRGALGRDHTLEAPDGWLADSNPERFRWNDGDVVWQGSPAQQAAAVNAAPDAAESLALIAEVQDLDPPRAGFAEAARNLMKFLGALAVYVLTVAATRRPR